MHDWAALAIQAWLGSNKLVVEPLIIALLMIMDLP